MNPYRFDAAMLWVTPSAPPPSVPPPSVPPPSVPPPSAKGQKALKPLLVLGFTILAGWAVWAIVLRDALLEEHPEWDASSGIAARLILWILPCGIYLSAIWRDSWSQPLGLSFPLGRPQLLRTIFVVSLTAVLLVSSTVAQVGLTPREIVHALTGRLTSGWSAPIFEELVFRGVILSELLDWTHDSSLGARQLRSRYWLSQGAAATIFTLVHWPYWISHRGLSETLSLTGPVFVVGLMLGFVFAHTRSIWGCILLHWLNNQLSIL